MSQKKFSGAKVALLGAPGVGKTAFAVRYITKRYIGDYDSNKEMLYTYKPREELTLEIMDTASLVSSEETEKHYRWGDGFVLMYSITDRQSFLDASAMKDSLLRVKGQDVPIIVVANKADLASVRLVSEEEGSSLAEQLDCPKYEISVADGYQAVSECMQELLIQLKKDFVKSNTSAAMASMDKSKSSKLFNFKKGFKKRISRSHSDTV
ncbi:hypothetical protein FSP39_019613 [Pinctada imbricata]|uniref:small monomeric GTPase n=1 Tax=Pinctada imbricata TaxID=66713 RepID=A0AA88Y643_PINIB|nr:hypothetical protein FSP39_019613 [Pinctada imbricata]